MEPVKLIAIYARVSTARQEEEETILSQLIALREFALKNNYCIVQEYTDEGWSGDVLARPALDRLRQDAKQKIWNAALVYDPDRLARRYSYQELIMDELKEAGIELLFMTVAAPQNSEDKILYGVRGLFAEYERAKIAERFRLGKLRKVKAGNILTAEPLYGYNYIPKEEHREGYYTINETEASVVRMIFTWVAEEGLSQRNIIRRLQEMGIKPRKSIRGVWSTSTLTTMLRHKGYIGQAHWGKSFAVVPERPFKSEKYRKTKKTSRKERPEEEWYKIPIPSIINERLFNRAREQIARNLELSPRNRKNQYLLAGKIHCVCGTRRAGEGPQQGKHLYYRCSNRIHNFPLPATCTEKGINARIADALVWQQVLALMCSPELMLKQAERSMNARKEKVSPLIVDEAALLSEASKLKEQEDRYNKAYGAGIFSMEQLTAYLSPIREKKALVQNRLRLWREQKSNTDSMTVPDKKILADLAEQTKALAGDISFEVKRAIVMNVIQKVVGTKERLSVYGHIPVSPHVNFNSIHRYPESIISNDTFNHFGDKTVPFSFEIAIPNYDTFYNTTRQLRRNKRGRFIAKLQA